MRIQILSDLHLETQPHFVAMPAEGVDVLVLAGDIGSYQRGSKLPGRPGRRDFGLSQFASRAAGGRWPKVLFVPGNHEYDAEDFDSVHEELREVAESLGITWLERTVHIHQGVRFLGTTLWTDFDALAAAHTEMTDVLRLRHKAFRAANFYLSKAAGSRRGVPLLSEAWRELGLECQQWLRDNLTSPFSGSTVVVTHFAPSLRSADPRYGVTPATAGFCNQLDDALIAVSDLWVHGHLHCHNDYVVRSGARECRVIANPLGYASKGEQDSFIAGLVVDFPAAQGELPIIEDGSTTSPPLS